MRKVLALAAGTLFTLSGTTGCVDVEYGLALERDLSGTASLHVDVDLERMAYASAKLQKMFSEEGGEPTEEEIAAARQELLQQLEDEEDFTEEGMREEIEGELPEGMELLEVVAEDEGLNRHVSVRFGFDHVDLLSDVDVGPGQEGEDAPRSEPFGDLEVIDEGGTLLITNAPLNPVAVAKEQAQEGTPGVEGMIARAFEGLRVAFSIRAPFDVVEHNATRVDGSTLWWEYDFAALAGSGDELPDHIMVRYRK